MQKNYLTNFTKSYNDPLLYSIINMKLAFVTEGRFIRNQKGVVYGDPNYNYSFWLRYLEIFDKVYVLARVDDCATYNNDKSLISNGENVIFYPLPYYVGPIEYLTQYYYLNKIISKFINENSDCKFLCRVPGAIGNLVAKKVKNNGLNYAVEVVGDPEEVFKKGGVKHPLRIYFKYTQTRLLKKIVKNASASLYVTKKTLQKKYPPKKDTFTTHASNVQLENQNEIVKAKTWTDKSKINILSIGSLEQMYKSPDVVVEAIKLLNDKYPDYHLNLTWIGSGHYIDKMRVLSKNLNIEKHIFFLGQKNKRKVYEHYQTTDLFVLASRTEGLPRVVIEAMSFGLPIVATNVGGIPELLDEEVLVKKVDALELANKIAELLQKENFYNSQAKRNLKESYFYREELLSRRRNKFYQYIKDNV